MISRSPRFRPEEWLHPFAKLSHLSNKFSSPLFCYLFVVVRQGLCSLCYHKKVELFPHFSSFSCPQIFGGLVLGGAAYWSDFCGAGFFGIWLRGWG